MADWQEVSQCNSSPSETVILDSWKKFWCFKAVFQHTVCKVKRLCGKVLKFREAVFFMLGLRWWTSSRPFDFCIAWEVHPSSSCLLLHPIQWVMERKLPSRQSALFFSALSVTNSHCYQALKTKRYFISPYTKAWTFPLSRTRSTNHIITRSNTDIVFVWKEPMWRMQPKTPGCNTHPIQITSGVRSFPKLSHYMKSRIKVQNLSFNQMRKRIEMN